MMTKREENNKKYIYVYVYIAIKLIKQALN